MTYKKISKNPEWTVNPATYKLYKSFDWERWIMKACGITDDANSEVNRITNNRCRIDNASDGRQSCFGTMDESMLLMNPSSFENLHERNRIASTADDFGRVGQGYCLKNVLGGIYDYPDKQTAEVYLDLWYADVLRFGHKEMNRAAESIMQRKEGILAWYDNPISNGYAEGINSMIQTTKRITFGHSNVENFMMLAYLRNGNLEIVFDR